MRLRPDVVKRVAGGAVAVLLAVCVVAQVVLPRIAERRVRNELRNVGVVSDVKVSAFPAVKLLFGEIDTLKAKLGSSSTTNDELAGLLSQTKRIDRLRVSAPRIDVSGVRLADFRVVKNRDNVEVDGTVSTADVAALAPANLDIQRVFVVRQHLRVTGSIDALGARVAGQADVVTRDGAIVATAADGPLAALGGFTVFANDRVRVDRLVVRADPDADDVRAMAYGRLE